MKRILMLAGLVLGLVSGVAGFAQSGGTPNIARELQAMNTCAVSLREYSKVQVLGPDPEEDELSPEFLQRNQNWQGELQSSTTFSGEYNGERGIWQVYRREGQGDEPGNIAACFHRSRSECTTELIKRLQHTGMQRPVTQAESDASVAPVSRSLTCTSHPIQDCKSKLEVHLTHFQSRANQTNMLRISPRGARSTKSPAPATTGSEVLEEQTVAAMGTWIQQLLHNLKHDEFAGVRQRSSNLFQANQLPLQRVQQCIAILNQNADRHTLVLNHLREVEADLQRASNRRPGATPVRRTTPQAPAPRQPAPGTT